MQIFAKIIIDKKDGKIIGFRFTDETIRRLTDIEFIKGIRVRRKVVVSKIIS